MRELPVRLPPTLAAKPRRKVLREAFYFTASFAATFLASVLMMEHMTAVLS